MGYPLKFTENQKRVLLGLTLFPEESDSFISEYVKVRRSTFATVKKKLLNPHNNLIIPLNIPNFHLMGVELITFGASQLNLNKTLSYNRDEVIKRLKYYPNIISASTDFKYGFVLVVSKSFTDLAIAHNAIASFYIEENMAKNTDMLRSIIPLNQGNPIRFLEYGRILENFWKIKINNETTLNQSYNEDQTSINQISPLGWTIFENLLIYPELSVLELSKAINKPRNTITRWIRKFQQINLYHKKFIPNLIKLGVNIQVIISISVRGLNNSERNKTLMLIDKFFSPVSLFTSYNEILFESYFPNFQNLRKTESEFIDFIIRSDLPLRINKKYVLLLDKIQYPKTLKSALPALIKYLRNPKKISLKPYLNDL